MTSDSVPTPELLYPFYLDTDMTMSFAAALTGGVALESENLNQISNDQETTRQLRAGLRMFDFLDIGGSARKARKQSVNSESRVVRRHTEASIFINLMQELTRRGSVVQPNLNQLKTGEIVSIEIGPATAPLLRVVNQILRLLEITSPKITEAAPQKTRQPGGQRPKPNPSNSPAASANLKSTSEPDSLNQARNLFESLKGDLEFSGMTDILVKRENELSVILTLDNRFISDQCLELLQTSTSRVVGKVTRIWPQDSDVINLYRRSVLSLVPALPTAMMFMVFGMLGGMAKAIDVLEIQRQTNLTLGLDPPEEQENPEIRFSDDIAAMVAYMNGPAIQILPLAVCA